MDEMKISSKFMRNLIAKFVERAVKKNVGYKINIQLNELTATVTDEKAHIHLNVDAEMTPDELRFILGTIGKFKKNEEES